MIGIPAPLNAEDDSCQPIAALNDLLFCERRCALHRIEQVWADSPYTLQGTQVHQRAHTTLKVDTATGVRVAHGLWLRSSRLGLVGRADVVEFRRGSDGADVPYPVEYKRGRRRRWDNDDVQVCAQALCLEEMLGAAVPAGAVFHARSRRRREVAFNAELGATTERAARRLHELVAAQVTPPPVLQPRCRGCSLLELCMPARLAARPSALRYLARTVQLMAASGPAEDPEP